MKRLPVVNVLIILHYVAWCAGTPYPEAELPQRYPDVIDPQESPEVNPSENQPILSDTYRNRKLDSLTNILAELLVYPWPSGGSPLLYVEPNPVFDDEITDKNVNAINFYKRSKYYRKYPWKRQNRYMYDNNPYYCQPTKEDVFRLLVALHEARQGNRGRTVNFCNRKRPASAIFTNIRFLGKRK